MNIERQYVNTVRTPVKVINEGFVIATLGGLIKNTSDLYTMKPIPELNMKVSEVLVEYVFYYLFKVIVKELDYKMGIPDKDSISELDDGFLLDGENIAYAFQTKSAFVKNPLSKEYYGKYLDEFLLNIINVEDIKGEGYGDRTNLVILTDKSIQSVPDIKEDFQNSRIGGTFESLSIMSIRKVKNGFHFRIVYYPKNDNSPLEGIYLVKVFNNFQRIYIGRYPFNP